MPDHLRKEKAADRAERLIIEGILSDLYPPGSDLPGERLLCKELGVARPALREALQRLSRDGWLDIQQGKATHVRDYIRDGNLSLLPGLLSADPTLLNNFIPDLLEMWAQLAPAYTAAAISNSSREIIRLLEGFRGLADLPRPYARAMWRLHHTLIDYSGNIVYGLIFNSFTDFYVRLASVYYIDPERRQAAHVFWRALANAASITDPAQAAVLVGTYLQQTRNFWLQHPVEQWGKEIWEQIDNEDLTKS